MKERKKVISFKVAEDDEQVIRKELRKILTKKGYTLYEKAKTKKV